MDRRLFNFFLLFNLCTIVGCLNEEGIALLAFKQAITEDPKGALGNWNPSDENPCSWNGITCNNFKVSAISMPKIGLAGIIPSILGTLSYLRHLNLRNNRIHGNLPSGIFDVLGLQSLVLYGNNMSGSLPNEFANLRYLQILDLSQNFFNELIPSSLSQCKRLRSLDLSHNNFTGSLPNGFGNDLKALEKLDLSYNKLNGSIPSDIGNLTSFQGTIDLSHNVISGQIPASLGNLPEKVYIDLAYNNLSGPIPKIEALVNRGPTVFMGNPNLCGPPLKRHCSPDSPFSVPSVLPYQRKNDTHQPYDIASPSLTIKRRNWSRHAVIAIVASDIIGLLLIALIIFYCYWRMILSRRNEKESSSGKGIEAGRDCFCFSKEESEAQSENVEQYDLVPLDSCVSFDLDELLKASAFILGKSGLGIVYKVVLEDGLAFAVRRLGGGGSQRYKEFQREVEAIGKLSHPNIVTLRAYYWSVDEKLLVYDFIPNGNLGTAIHGRGGMPVVSPLSWVLRLRIMKGIAMGLAYLHEFSPKKYVHGDLRPTNILLGKNMEPHVSDFGLSRLATVSGGSTFFRSYGVANEKTVKHETSVGSNMGSFYQAPEALKLLKSSQKSDVYSYGVILLELISGKSPMVLINSLKMDLLTWVRSCIDENKPLSCLLDPFLDQEAEKEDEIILVIKIALSCVSANAERRPSMRHVVEALEKLSSD